MNAAYSSLLTGSMMIPHISVLLYGFTGMASHHLVPLLTMIAFALGMVLANTMSFLEGVYIE